MARKSDPVSTLENISTIIAKDVKRLSKKVAGSNSKKNPSKPTDLSAEDALTLSRHASTLIDIQNAHEKTKDKMKKELEKTPIEDLLKQFQDDQQQKEPKDETV